MGYLDGEALKHLIGERPLETEKLLPIAIGIAEGLEAAHAEGIGGLVAEFLRSRVTALCLLIAPAANSRREIPK